MAISKTILAWILLAIGVPCTFPCTLLAQPAVSDLPRTEFYVAAELYGAGQLGEAAKGYEVALRLARQVGQERWIDSIPPLVMLGECYFQQGDVAMAMEHYDAALMLALENPGWIDQIEVGAEQLPPLENASQGINWFAKSRPTVSVAIPESVQISIDPTQAQVDPQGNVVGPVSLVTRLDATEVLRSLGVAMMRRWQLLGPLATHSPLARPLEELFSRNPRQQAPWVQHSWSVLRGISHLPNSRRGDAPAMVRDGVLILGQFDYFMSPLALLVLAQVDGRDGKYQSAIGTLQDASLLAAQYEQHGELAEVLSLLSVYSVASQRVELLEPLQQAAAWCRKRSVLSQLSALTGIAELAFYAGKTPQADTLLQQAWSGLRVRGVALPRIQAQAFYVGALLGFSSGRGAAGQTNLDSALKLMQGDPRSGAVAARVFQTQMTLDLLATGALTARDSEQILVEVLSEPEPSAWEIAPLETLSAITTPNLRAFEQLLELAAARKDPTEVLARMDRLQRQRLYEALPLGGRLFCWRSAASSDPQSLPANVRQVMQASFQQSPQLQTLPQEISGLVGALRGGPLPLDERQLPPDGKKSFAQLQDLSERLENLLHLQTLSRLPLDRYQFPPARMAVIQQTLQPGDVALSFAVTNQSIFGAAVSRDAIELWQVDQVEAVRATLDALLVEIDLKRRSAAMPPSAVTDASAAWRQTAHELRALLFPTAAQQMISPASRLIVSPNAQLWYVPFELLPENDAADAQPWLAKRSITYAPTLGSISVAFAPRPVVRDTVGFVGHLFAADKATNDQLAELLIKAVPNSFRVALAQKITVPHSLWLRLRADQMWVASEIDNTRAGWDAVLLPLGKSRQSPLGAWLETPRVAPRQLLLPGFKTSMQRGSALREGNDILLPVCTLLYSGTRSAIISRWSVGGASSQRLLQRTLEELDDETASQALRRSVLALWAEDFLISEEPSLLPAGKEASELTSGRHPLLWSGYMSVGDTVPK